MYFLNFFHRESKSFYINLFVLSVFNSLLYSGMLYIITSSINETALFVLDEYKGMLFLSFIILSFIGNKLFQNYSARLTNRVVYREELAIIERLKECAYNNFEKIGVEKVYTALDDSKVLGGIPGLLLTLLNSTIIIFCGLIFLLYTFSFGFLMVFAMISILFLFYWQRNVKIQKDLNILRDSHDEFHKYLRDFLVGVKELKTNRDRNDSVFHDYIEKNRKKTQELDLKTLLKYIFNEITGSYSWYLVLFAVIFVFPSMFEFSNEKSTTFVMVIFYLMGPVSALIGSIDDITRTKIAFERIGKFQKSTSSKLDFDKLSKSESRSLEFTSIEFKDVFYQHVDDKNNVKFNLGPINLKIIKGEVIFITGGNGSGKSTFMYLFAGLYKPISGTILLNGKEVKSPEYLANCISSVFTDHHLFSENYDNLNLTNENQELNKLIKLVKLEDIIDLSNQEKLLDHNLSRGQRKRMSLVYALMERKPLIILDEWAAEQDPDFKKYFYQTILTQLKKKGKTIIAITHDSQYFDRADRHIDFEFGKINKDENILVK